MYCFTKAHEILTIKLMATNGECRAQCILVKTGSLMNLKMILRVRIFTRSNYENVVILHGF